MKITKLLFAFIFFISLATYAQPGKIREKVQQKKEQVKAMKIAYITTELNLTTDEAAKFWPLFNAFEDKQRELKQEKLKSYIDRSDSDKLTEKEATTLLQQMETTEEELHQLRKKFVGSLKSVLPAVKILKLKKAEEQFSRKLLQQMRENRGK